MKRGDMILRPDGLHFAGRRLAVGIGRGGVSAAKREGDGATPQGAHRIVGMMYRPDRIAKPALPDWAVPMGPRDLWSDDVEDPDYNLLTRAPHPFGHERLRRADPLYDLILIVGWNWPWAVPGKGSAIFLHRWRRPGFPTAGCIAMAPQDLIWLARRVLPQTRLIVPPQRRSVAAKGPAFSAISTSRAGLLDKA